MCPPTRAEAPSRGSPGVPERPPPPPSAAGWAEFLNASGGARGESAVALLTLSDQEQHELYEAARLVQGAFRKYRVRQPLRGGPPKPPGTPCGAADTPSPKSLPFPPPGPEAEGAAGDGGRRHPALLPQV